MIAPTIRVGVSHGWHQGRIDADAAVAFAAATNDTNEVYLRGEAVPPLFTVSLVRPAMAGAVDGSVDPGAIKGARAHNVHAEHDLYLWNPVVPGMAVQWELSTYAARQTPAGVIVTQRALVTDVEGIALVEHFWSTIHPGGTIDADLGPALADHRFPEAARDRLLGTRIFDIARDQTFRFAGVSGDHVPHAMDDEEARREGYSGKIVQGLCTLAMCGSAAVSVGAGGDPFRLRRLSARFSAPMYPRQQLAVAVCDAGRTGEGGRALAFEATSNGVTCIRHGRAELLAD